MTTAVEKRTVLNYIAGKWCASSGEHLDVTNPATAQVLARVPISTGADVAEAVRSATEAAREWRAVPVTERVQYLFKLKSLLEANIDELARIVTNECGKTFGESVGELRRGIENVEVACGAATLMQGFNNEDIARGIDEHMFRQPVGVVAAITPFNFPAMIPLWFLPYAIAFGNCFILKPSEKVPMTSARLFELLDETGLPTGVVQLVNGAKEAVDALLDHPGVRAISFVGSTPVARYVYQRATASGKRAQCQGGAKNAIVIMPDADMDTTIQIAADSAFGCAGQRCLAASVAIPVGDAMRQFREAMIQAALTRRVGYGLDDGVQMGPVITPDSKVRIENLIDRASGERVNVTVDGRGRLPKAYQKGNFICPTILEHADTSSDLLRTEIFGPVISLLPATDLQQAIAFANSMSYGNMACLFTSSGAAAREFRYNVAAGNIGINVGVAAPMAFFPFSGWKESFFGDLHGQGRHAAEFYTETKVVVERWPSVWSRQF